MVGVLVTGIPASGKSTLAAYLSKELRLPMMSKDKIKELQSFISRFSANKSKAKQATARRKLLDKLTVEEYGDNVLFCRTDDAARKPFSAGKQF